MRFSPVCAALAAAALVSALPAAAGQTVSTPAPPPNASPLNAPPQNAPPLNAPPLNASPPPAGPARPPNVQAASPEAASGNFAPESGAALTARRNQPATQPNIRSLIEEDQEGYNRRLEDTETELRDLRRRLQSGEIRGGILFPGRDPNSYQPFAPRIGGEAAEKTFPMISVSGFFQADTGFFDQDAASVATFGHIQNGADFRRARLIMLGSAAENLNYLMEMDFAQAGHPTFRDVWAEATDIPYAGSVRIGYFKAPFSLDELTSARQLTFLERSTVTNAFAPFRRMGIAAFNHDEEGRATWAAGVSRTLTDTYGGDIGSSGGFAGTTRVTALPYYDEPSGGRYYLHVGAAYEIAYPGNNTFSFRTIPGVFIGSQQTGGATGNSGVTLPGPVNGVPFFADTGKLLLQDFSLYGAEIAGSWGSFNFQSEWMATTVNQIHNPSVFMQGAYIQGSYFLTGEHRPYSRASGTIGSIKPHENFFILDRGRGTGWGAWEIAGRFSWLDLDDKNVKGGRLMDYTFGLNWFLHANVKIQFNYINAWVNNAVHGRSDTNIFATRLQGQF